MRSKGSADTLAEDEDALRQAAWRWRFNRRWAQEQARQMDPDYGRQVPAMWSPGLCTCQVSPGLHKSSTWQEMQRAVSGVPC